MSLITISDRFTDNFIRYFLQSRFSTRIVCGECGGYYGSKVWQSNNKYRKVVWRRNDKYKNANGYAACHTPHLSEDEIKTAFIGAFNSCRPKYETLCFGRFFYK